MMRHPIVLLSLLFTSPFTLADSAAPQDAQVKDVIEKVERDLEEWRHNLLYQTIEQANTGIKPFTTDGCSGGMSGGWQHMARVLPAFKKNFGDNPPWESCCVTHDRAYWAGATSRGFEKRREADRAMWQCVREFGQTHSNEFSQRFSIDRNIIEQQFAITAELMYRAVRVGGQPCTPLPWRWGYGWPHCQSEQPGKS
jgi:hypothetical protein